jgi:hypothetical protein
MTSDSLIPLPLTVQPVDHIIAAFWPIFSGADIPDREKCLTHTHPECKVSSRQIAFPLLEATSAVPYWALGSTQLRRPTSYIPFLLAPTGRLMRDRYDALKAVALILLRMDKITEKMGKPGTPLESLQYEWNKLETKYQKLMARLVELPHKRQTS